MLIIVVTQPGNNVTKYQSYKYAFERMKQAIEREFFLEAIMIAESIISDRLISYLSETKTRTYLYQLVEKWEKIDNQVTWKDRTNLIIDVKTWGRQRNICAHQVVKSLPGEPTTAVEEFTFIAQECALEGQILARYVCDWRSAQKRKKSVKS